MAKTMMTMLGAILTVVMLSTILKATTVAWPFRGEARQTRGQGIRLAR